MPVNLPAIISAIPWIILGTILTSLFLLILGWILSIRAAGKSDRGRDLKLLLIFPLTNPLALLIFAFMDFRPSILPIICYLLGLLTIPVGGALAEKHERSLLESLKQKLENSGEFLTIESITPEPVPDDSNVWKHPFLEELGVAGQNTPEGRLAREHTKYESLSLPKPYPNSHYPKVDREDRRAYRAFHGPLLDLHQTAMAIISATDGEINESNTPNSWSGVGEAVINYFQDSEADFAHLEEAINRPIDEYPYHWPAAFAMLIPQLPALKKFSDATAMRSVGLSAAGKSNESFRSASLAFKLVQIGDSDMLISRLVQFAQAARALQTVRAAQQFHVWTDEQWVEIQAELSQLDFPRLMPDAMRMERLLGYISLDPLLTETFARIVRGLGAFDASSEIIQNSEIAAQEIGGERLANIFFGAFSRAFLTKQVRLCLIAYSDQINSLERALEQTATSPWSQHSKPSLPKPYNEYGILAAMLLPALDRGFQKAINAQTAVELAEIACALERYYLANQQYPDHLDALIPNFLERPPRDPMSQELWHYTREGAQGFQIYSVGENGRDDGGDYQYDILWIIDAQMPTLPELEH